MMFDWKILFENHKEACVTFFYWLIKEPVPVKTGIDHSHIQSLILNNYPRGITIDDFFSFFDTNEILVGVYPKNREFFVAFAANDMTKLLCNDLENRFIANEWAVNKAFKLLNDKLNLYNNSNTT